MKSLTLLLALTFTGLAHADSEIEANIFNTLVAKGVYMNFRHTSPSEVPGAGTFHLESIYCTAFQQTKFSCSFVDAARPLDRTPVDGTDAEVLYRNLEASGVVPVTVPFTHGHTLSVFAQKLECDKAGFSLDRVRYNCQRLKPLLN